MAAAGGTNAMRIKKEYAGSSLLKFLLHEIQNELSLIIIPLTQRSFKVAERSWCKRRFSRWYINFLKLYCSRFFKIEHLIPGNMDHWKGTIKGPVDLFILKRT